MAYRFEVDRADHADLASGAVLRSAPGFPAFPVRLASELFQRAAELRGPAGPLRVWDPCCGSGHLLAVVGLRHRDRLRGVLGSDADPDAIPLAEANLGLLRAGGLAARGRELAGLADAHGKPAHRAAARAADRLAEAYLAAGGDLPAVVARADVFQPDQLAPLVADDPPDVVLTDVPYGERTGWLAAPDGPPLPALLASLAAVLPAATVLVVTCRARRVPLGVRPEVSVRTGTRASALIRVGQLG